MGGGEYFQREGQEKILLCKGVGWGHYMKNKNIGGGGGVDLFCQLNLISKKGPNAKMRAKCKKLTNIEKFVLARFAHSAFCKIHISGAANRHAPVQYAKYVFIFFFLSSHHDTNPLLHLYHFRKKKNYNYILANINSESSRVIFSTFFCLHPVGQTFLYPSKFCNHFEAQC